MKTSISFYSGFLLGIALIIISSKAISQSIVSVSPNAGQAGQSLLMNIVVDKVNLLGTTPMLNMGEGIDVEQINIVNASVLYANVRIAPGASLGFRDINLGIGDIRLQSLSGFQVIAGGIFNVMLQVMPVQTIYVSDFDQDNLQNAPLLFNVVIQNDGTDKKLRVKLTVSGRINGDLVTGEKEIPNITAMQSMSFSNRDFDKYSPNKAKSAVFDAAVKTGKLPADEYTYLIEVFENNKLLGSDRGINITNNPIARPELISPGTLVGQSPMLISSKMPLFQWFSQATNNSLMLYPVYDGQRNKEEIAINRPVFEQHNIASNVLQYPASAEFLEEGLTYAWQIIGKVQGTRGVEDFPSELFWFTYTENAEPNIQGTLSILPEVYMTGIAGFRQFDVVITDKNGVAEKINEKVTWKVVPEECGSISTSGYFRGSDIPGTCAVVATLGNQHTYCVVTLTGNPELNIEGVKKYFLRVFGLE